MAVDISQHYISFPDIDNTAGHRRYEWACSSILNLHYNKTLSWRKVPPQISTYCEFAAEKSAETAIIGGGKKNGGGGRKRERVRE